MNETFTLFGDTHHIEEYEKLFPPTHKERTKFEKYGAKSIGFKVKNITSKKIEDIQNNFGIYNQQTSDTNHQDSLESSILTNGWLMKYLPPTIDISYSGADDEIDGRDRERVLLRQRQLELPIHAVDLSGLTIDRDEYIWEVGQDSNNPDPAKRTGKKDIWTRGIAVVNKGLLDGTDSVAVRHWVENRTIAPEIFASPNQKKVITEIVNYIVRCSTEKSAPNNIYSKDNVLIPWLKDSIKINSNGFWSKKGVNLPEDVILLNVGEAALNRAEQTYVRHLLKNLLTPTTTKIALYANVNFLVDYKRGVDTFKKHLDKLIYNGILVHSKHFEWMNKDLRIGEAEISNPYEIIGYIPTSTKLSHKSHFELHHLLDYDSMFSDLNK